MGALLRCLLLSLALLITARSAVAGRLSTSYYHRSCLHVQQIVTDVVATKQRVNPSTVASTLRLFFHDCFVSSCNASILVSPLSSDQSLEHTVEINLSLSGDAFDAVARTKVALEAACPRTVSYTNILALAARNLVGILGGPHFPITLGHCDARRSDVRDVEGNLCRTNMFARAMTVLFGRKGLTPQEMVALASAHTINLSHCSEISHRLYNFRSVDGYDPSLNPAFTRALQSSCANYKKDPTISIFNDIMTPWDFDKLYFENLPRGLRLLASNVALWEYEPTRVFVQLYADNRTAFFEGFAKAMQKLGTIGVKTGWQGIVRRHCDVLI